MQDRIYECEAKKLVIRDGAKTREWRTVAVVDVRTDNLHEYRCKDCHGAVRLHRKRVPNGPAPHAEHLYREDSEYCPSGSYFRQNPGRRPRLSLRPVE